MSGKRVLVVNADDFGRSPGINAGIVRAHLEGIVTSTTLMVNLPWTEDAVENGRRVPGLAIGLHLNFCYGRPVSEAGTVPTLVDQDGNLVTEGEKLLATARPEDISREASAQLERFERLTGRMPSHLDSHKYLHSYEPFRSAVAPLAAEWKLPVRATGPDDRSVLRSAGIPTTDFFEGRYHGLDGEGVEQHVLDRVIQELPEGITELMCHPGFVDEHLYDSSYRDDRERELEVLCSGATRRTIERCGVQLGTYLDLIESR